MILILPRAMRKVDNNIFDKKDGISKLFVSGSIWTNLYQIQLSTEDNYLTINSYLYTCNCIVLPFYLRFNFIML